MKQTTERAQKPKKKKGDGNLERWIEREKGEEEDVEMKKEKRKRKLCSSAEFLKKDGGQVVGWF